MLHEDIFLFWKWFSQTHNELESETYDPAILQQIDTTILRWGLTWEIGPGQLKKNSFTISPQTNIDLLELTERIISYAPLLDDWEYYSSKQAKENWHLLKLSAEKISVNAIDWKYQLLRYEDDKTEILVKADNLSDYDEDTKNLVMEIVLINLLGEKAFMQKIDYFDILKTSDNDEVFTEICHLPDHLRKIDEAVNLGKNKK